MKIDLTPLFQAIIALLAALITFKVIPYIKSKTTEQQQENLQVAAKIAVYAAEQIFGGKEGDEKFRYAVQSLEDAGYTVSREQVVEAIEKAVHDMNAFPTVGEILCDLQDSVTEDEESEDIPGIDEPITELAEGKETAPETDETENG